MSPPHSTSPDDAVASGRPQSIPLASNLLLLARVFADQSGVPLGTYVARAVAAAMRRDSGATAEATADELDALIAGAAGLPLGEAA